MSGTARVIDVPAGIFAKLIEVLASACRSEVVPADALEERLEGGNAGGDEDDICFYAINVLVLEWFVP